MAHFAQLNNHSIVLRVLAVSNKDTEDENGNEREEVGVTFLQNIFGLNTIWKQTSYTGNFRKNYAAIGFSYDSLLDAFIPPKPFPSWLLNTTTAQWEPPTPEPPLTEQEKEQGYWYDWDEDSLSWLLKFTPRG